MQLNSIIKIKTPENPKRGTKARQRFDLYHHTTTVRGYLRACKRRGIPVEKAKADVKWDERHGYIETIH